MEKPKKIRSKEYPACTLNEAIEFVIALKDYVMLPSIPYEVAAKQTNVSVTTKSFKYRISSARQYGLIATSSGKTLTFLDSARAFAFPTDTVDLNQLKLDSFSAPKLYSDLLELYGGKSIPTQQSLENVLITSFGIAPNAKEVAAKTFIDTANEIGAVVGGILTLDVQSAPVENDQHSNNETDSIGNDISKDNEDKHKKRENVDYTSHYKFEIPTLGSNTATLLIPNNVNEKDIDFIDMCIKTMLPTFLTNLKSEIAQTTE